MTSEAVPSQPPVGRGHGAVSEPLQTVPPALPDGHLAHGVTGAFPAGGPDREVELEEASAAITRLGRS